MGMRGLAMVVVALTLGGCMQATLEPSSEANLKPRDKTLLAKLDRLARSDTPLAGAPRMRDAHWVEPELVAEVSFAEWTNDGILRQPVFLGLRSDKAAKKVKREAGAV